MFAPPQPSALLTGPIHRLFDEHVARPLLHLNERGLQARLANLILATLGPEQGLAAAELALGSLHGYRTQDRVLRVQQGIGIVEATHAPDLVLLRAATAAAPLRLRRLGAGHLDLEPAVAARDAEAVFTVRAACTAEPPVREGLRAAVASLHELARRCLGQGAPAPECHLVLVDRSMAVREHASCVDRRRDLQWDLAEDRPWSWAGAGRLGSSHVHVWDFDEGGELRHRVSAA